MRPIFIFSLPRSGSTLLQRYLGGHTQIDTVSEPWLLLPFFYAKRRWGVLAEYDHGAMSVAFQDFCAQLPGGEDDYRREVRAFVEKLYRAVGDKDCRYFIDKTPRYHLIIDEILATFPDGKFIFLWRNPVDIVASLSNTWSSGRWNLDDFSIDLYQGFTNLSKAFIENRDRVFAVNYEEFVADPETTAAQIFEFLNLDNEEAIAECVSQLSLEGRLGDQIGSGKYRNVSRQSVGSWQLNGVSALRRGWCRKYIEWIGRERLEVIGYDKDEILASLENTRISILKTFSDLFWRTWQLLFTVIDPGYLKSRYRAVRENRRHYRLY